MVSFDPLWKTLEKKGITQYKLINTYKISRGQIFRLRHNQNASMKIVNKLCSILDCDITDIITYTKDPSVLRIYGKKYNQCILNLILQLFEFDYI